MSNSSTAAIPDWVANRILEFFNTAESVSQITETIQDDPSDGPGNTIGATLAARILRTRNQLPRRRFTDLEQIDAIRGVGEGTLKDLQYTFHKSAASAFQNSMYDNNVIFRANWTLEFDQTIFHEPAQFEELIQDPDKLRAWVADKIHVLAKESETSDERTKMMTDNIKETYMDYYTDFSFGSAVALALWFFEHDQDNWFGWETILNETINYFDFHTGGRVEGSDLVFFKGFQLVGIIPPGITADDLPVIINKDERAITIWFSALYD